MVENNNMIYIKYELASRLYQLNESPIKILTPDSTLQALNISSHIDDEKHKKNFMETQQQLQNIINNYSSDNIKKINELLNNGIVVIATHQDLPLENKNVSSLYFSLL